jgi:hypothetical protein
MIGNVQPPAVRPRHAPGGFVRFCAKLCVC